MTIDLHVATISQIPYDESFAVISGDGLCHMYSGHEILFKLLKM